MSRPTRADPGGRAYLDLQNRARREGRFTQELLVLYSLERFLARLAVSPHAGTFILKGGMLLAALNARRATVDADLLATQLTNTEEAVLTRVVEIAAITPTTDDGVEYLLDTARARTIREGALYTGVRVSMDARIARATAKLQLDINFGDPVTPAPATIAYPALRDGDPPVMVLGYPLATVLAEKICTAIDLGAANSRLRDYADLWTLTRIHDIDADELCAALTATATHRGVVLRQLAQAVANLADIRSDAYAAFRRRQGDDALALPDELAELIAAAMEFADPVLAESSPVAGQTWRAGDLSWHP